jgi:MFS superfamily sulfate permease-like transporter
MYKRLEINQKASRRTNPASNIFGTRVQAARAATAGLGGYLRQSSRPDLATGLTNTIVLTTAGIMVAFSGQPDYIEFVFALAIASGVVKLLLGLLNPGSIVQYTSKSVLAGSLSAATVLIK